MDGTDRRTLLAGIGGASVLALAGGRAMAQPVKPMRYAVVGLGSYAVNQIMPQFANSAHSKLTALVSGTPAKLEKYGALYGIPRSHRYSYATYDSIRNNPDIDAVYVVLPNNMHAEYSIRASQAGKHVMCEKPMSVSSAEAEAMIAAAHKAGRKLMIGYRSQFEQYNRHGIDVVKQGVLGPVRLITAQTGFNASPNQWRLEKAMAGGGSLMDIGIYSLQAARYLAGEEPVAVTAMESTDRHDPRFREVEDRIDFLLRFPSGAIANCVSSYSSGHNNWRVTGTKGWLGMEPATGYDGHRMWLNKDWKTQEVLLPAGHPNQWVGQLDELALSVAQGREPIASGQEGLRDMRLVEAIYQSAREGRTVQLT
ncbi:Gfo/Idh/MocA family oxidoreductase [Sandaracinobacter neustonicus]|uniref:Gfo/Idh/MocA family oxidoreductase n=1 Tax=Sandaracinobacter neustonicus TaxID=1715348 RepID=A0A501XJN7_9SPHN|nr:Gfo/Idh/MocA family oxidoreductase [Sandaracinobacter neustonicus]TPE60629.1 Gfo/Idh/MocA family oxidoreductase [Sandaracinobacter neustonicus]